jgi:sulfur-oxidizing protein SoxY
MLLPPAGWNTGVPRDAGRAGRMETDVMTLQVSRRQALALGAGGLAAATGGLPTTALAKNDADEIIKTFTGGKEPLKGRVKLDLPEIAENGNTVPMTVSVESPMTDASYVTDILVVADQNPRAGVVHFRLSPLSGVAEANTRIRLAETQNVIALARMNDGAVFTDSKLVKVTIGGCGG